ncbi:MAG: amidohydrolase [Clostridia bacterium]|nr:amidohydrolase [Clostridia bacterium]
MTQISERIKAIVADNIRDFELISDYIFNNPELGEEEVKAAKYLTEYLKTQGFTVSFPVEEMPTAFVAEYGNKEAAHFTIGFPAEYDALPGYGPNGEPAHACGHNWISATMCGCGVVLSKLAEELGLVVKVIGTPAEESTGGKYNLCQVGAFDDCDVVLQAHLAEASCLETKTLAMDSLEFSYYGKASHAAQFPEQGINALDGVLHLFSGINSLRQHVRSDARIHGIITHGGEAPNIVPDFAQCQISVRALDRKYMREVQEKVIRIAEGAALIPGAKMEYRHYENPYDDIRNNKELIACVQKNLTECGIKDFVPGYEYLTPGSSDLGNVSYICPTLYFEVDPEGEYTCVVHDPSALKIVNSEAAYRKMEQVIEGFSLTAVELCQDSELMSRMKKEFEEGIC